ncbi:hypothetical protein CFP56_040978 [Quercus suber]|uniref:Uncharacterized protein n=1 Tax=Quercus suber TaxID=58331 RepID=A0AAW0LKV7_QUESU
MKSKIVIVRYQWLGKTDRMENGLGLDFDDQRRQGEVKPLVRQGRTGRRLLNTQPENRQLKRIFRCYVIRVAI